MSPNGWPDRLDRQGCRVNLARAWQVCHLLDRIDESHRDRDTQRTLALTAPRREDETTSASSPLGTLVP